MTDRTKRNSLAGTWLNSSLRDEWLDEVIHLLHVAFGRAIGPDVHDTRHALESWTATLPRPATYVEERVLRGLLIEFACRFGDEFHRRHHRRAPATCGFIPLADLERFWTEPGHAVDGFIRWMIHFFDRFEQAHPPSPAESAARFIEDHFDQPLDVEGLASYVRISRSQLVATFRARYGIAPREFQRMIRLAEALTHVKGEKIEALALRVGYKSRKNFYSAFRKATGLTPAELRKLPNGQIAEIIDSINRRLMRAPRSRRHAADSPDHDGRDSIIQESSSPALVTLAKRTGAFTRRSNGIEYLVKRALDEA